MSFFLALLEGDRVLDWALSVPLEQSLEQELQAKELQHLLAVCSPGPSHWSGSIPE